MLTPIISNAQEISTNHNYIDKSLALVQTKIKASRAEYRAAINSQSEPSPIVVDLAERLDSLLNITSNYVKEDYSFDCYFENGYSGKINSKGTMIELTSYDYPDGLKLKVLEIEKSSSIDADGQITGTYLFKGNNETFLIIKYKVVDGKDQIIGEQLSARIKLAGSKYSDYGLCKQNN